MISPCFPLSSSLPPLACFCNSLSLLLPLFLASSHVRALPIHRISVTFSFPLSPFFPSFTHSTSTADEWSGNCPSSIPKSGCCGISWLVHSGCWEMQLCFQTRPAFYYVNVSLRFYLSLRRLSLFAWLTCGNSGECFYLGRMILQCHQSSWDYSFPASYTVSENKYSFCNWHKHASIRKKTKQKPIRHGMKKRINKMILHEWQWVLITCWKISM